jgi:hypothetical protein
MNPIGAIARLSTLAALAVLAAAPVYGQGRTYEPVVPQGISEQRVEPAGELAQPSRTASVPPRLVQNRTRAQSDADARHCLTASSNKDIHRCAQRYLPASARAATVRRASVKAPAPKAAARPAVEISRSTEIVKPGPPRPGDAAKAAEIVKPMDVTKPGGTPRAIEPAPKAADAGKGKATPSTSAGASPTPPAVLPKLPPMGSAADPTAAPARK